MNERIRVLGEPEDIDDHWGGLRDLMTGVTQEILGQEEVRGASK